MASKLEEKMTSCLILCIRESGFEMPNLLQLAVKDDWAFLNVACYQMMPEHKYTVHITDLYTHIYRDLTTVGVEDQNMTEGSHTLLRFHVSTPGRWLTSTTRGFCSLCIHREKERENHRHAVHTAHVQTRWHTVYPKYRYIVTYYMQSSLEKFKKNI